MQAIHPSIQHGGAMERPGNRPQSVPTAGTTTPPTGSTTVTDEITLSAEAKSFIEGAGPGKSGDSPAHRARAMMAEGGAPVGMSFGKIVSSLARGIEFTPAVPPADGGGDAPAGDIAPLDGIDPIAPVIEEGTAPIAPAATEGEVLPVADGTDSDVPVVLAATEGAIPVAGTGSEILDLFPVLEPVAEPEAGLLETLDAAIDEATDENPDGLGGVDIAA